ncbi:hypothetical protein ACQF36_36255 [Streptomyces sp. Marseille-Q5077]
MVTALARYALWAEATQHLSPATALGHLNPPCSTSATANAS